MEKQEMTDARQTEIMQALEHCIADDCSGCPYVLLPEETISCENLLLDNVYEYIEFLKAVKG